MRADGFQMPRVTIGDFVLFHQTKDHPDGILALVKQASTDTVTVLTFPQQAAMIGHEEGCRHQSDPVLRNVDPASSHCWSEWPAQASIYELMDMLPKLRKMLEQWQKSVKGGAAAA